MGFLKQPIKLLQKQDPARIGSIPGVKLFARFQSRQDLYIAGVHGKHEGGIHGRAAEGAFSVIVAGRYEDDVDYGDIILYTGEGGHSRASEMQYQDQDWVRGNLALKHSCATKRPVRVIRSHVLRSKYAPASGYRYDGLYRVTNAEQVTGKNGHAVCRFVLERIPGQAPLPGPGWSGAASSSSRGGSVEDDLEEEDNKPPVAGPSRQPVAAPRKRVAQKKKPSADLGGIQFKYEGSDSPPRPIKRESGFGPAPPLPGFR
ncbi:hypothetical protein FA13DRAFT_1791440 [Coprinellus micaceus]|uniref:YDG domain-containing protein n=1 Tax=Coprinellus micaceus TaxID=71717 RepID=A0A4Y7TC21_COPMI|nr:hypothetical protein FA13DRAFT_1791440 [Coprinellus micaceus]